MVERFVESTRPLDVLYSNVVSRCPMRVNPSAQSVAVWFPSGELDQIKQRLLPAGGTVLELLGGAASCESVHVQRCKHRDMRFAQCKYSSVTDPVEVARHPD